MARVLHEMRHRLPKFQLDKEAVNCHHNYVQREDALRRVAAGHAQGRGQRARRRTRHHPGQHGRAQLHRARQGQRGQLPQLQPRRRPRDEPYRGARAQITLKQHREATAHVECRKDAGVIDESPAAYKDDRRGDGGAERPGGSRAHAAPGGVHQGLRDVSPAANAGTRGPPTGPRIPEGQQGASGHRPNGARTTAPTDAAPSGAAFLRAQPARGNTAKLSPSGRPSGPKRRSANTIVSAATSTTCCSACRNVHRVRTAATASVPSRCRRPCPASAASGAGAVSANAANNGSNAGASILRDDAGESSQVRSARVA